MEKIYVANRKKSVSLSAFLLLFSCFCLFTTVFILDLIKIVDMGEKRVIFYVLIILIDPLLLFASIHYLLQLFNKEPVLRIDSKGLFDNSSKKSAGLIPWQNISDIIIVPYFDKTVYITVKLKDPSKYKLKRRKVLFKNAGEIFISSLYFKKEINRVLELINYYMKINKENND